MRICIGHDMLDEGEVIHLDCTETIGSLLHGRVKRCSGCEYWQKRFWCKRAQQKALGKELRDGR